MANGLDVKILTVALPNTATDWQGDDVVGHLFRAPSSDHGGGITILAAYAVNGAATGAGTGFSWQLENWGTAGTAIKSGSAGTIAAAVGGTADPFAQDTPKAFTISNAFVDAGEWVVIRKDEDNSSDPTRGVVSVHYVLGR